MQFLGSYLIIRGFKMNAEENIIRVEDPRSSDAV